MVVGYMSGSKRARSVASVANSTKIYGIMGGTISLTGRRDSIVHHIKRNPNICNRHLLIGRVDLSSQNPRFPSYQTWARNAGSRPACRGSETPLAPLPLLRVGHSAALSGVKSAPCRNSSSCRGASHTCARPPA